MATNIHTDFIPTETSLDIVAGIKRAVARVRSARLATPISKETFSRRRDKLNTIGPSVRKVFTKPAQLNSYYGYSSPQVIETARGKAKRVQRELLDAGITTYGLLKSESRILPKMLHPNEHVDAIVYGQHRSSSVMLVATDERIIFLDKKPMALFLDEVSYEVISGLELEIHTIFATLILHTPVKNYDIRFANLRCAANFARHVESQRLHKIKSQPPAPATGRRQILEATAVKSQPVIAGDDMAGYYLLPTEEDEET